MGETEIERLRGRKAMRPAVRERHAPGGGQESGRHSGDRDVRSPPWPRLKDRAHERERECGRGQDSALCVFL